MFNEVSNWYILSSHIHDLCCKTLSCESPPHCFQEICSDSHAFVIQPLIVRPNVVMRWYFRMRKSLCSVNVVSLVAWERDKIVPYDFVNDMRPARVG